MLPARCLRRSSKALLAVLFIATPALAQTTPPPLPSYTLQKHVREVLTDITVTDAHGNPVTGLPKSAFHVYDNGHLQTIDSFVAHSGNDLAVTPASTPSGVYSNSYLTHPPAVYNVALIDLTNMSIVEQMVLRRQLDHFLEKLSPNEPLAIYMRNGPRIVLVQNFTTSHAALLAAVRYAIPRMQATGGEYYTDDDVIRQFTAYLSQYPGRKNLLWFTGGPNSFLLYDAQLAGYSYMSASVNIRALYDALDAERIALYPIDVRGLIVSADLALPQQQLIMNEEAATTGGKAYYNTNAIALSARQILAHSSDFYTITYSPNDLHQRGRWHKVRITIDGPYHLSYRRGYFDDSPHAARRLKPILASNGEQIQIPNRHSRPIFFKVEILRAPAAAPSAATRKPPRGTFPYIVYYALPVSEFPITPLDARHSFVTIGAGIVVLDSHGNVVAHKMRLVKLLFKTSDIQAHPYSHALLQERLNIPKGQNDVYLALWNTSTGRLGTLQIPLTVKKHSARR